MSYFEDAKEAWAKYETAGDEEDRQELRQYFKENIAFLEGDIHHDDTQNIPTTPYGINLNIPEYKKWHDEALVANKGKPLSKDVYLDKAADIFMGYEDKYRDTIGHWGYESLDAQQKFTLHSAKYNTGDTFKT